MFLTKSEFTQEILTSGKSITKIIPENVYGVKLRVIAAPIFEDDSTISGAVGVGTSMQLQDSLYNSAKLISSTAEQISATSQELASTAVQLAEDINKVKNGGETVLTDISKTDNILKFVSEVANNSNLLGLNAAIEAARAGDQGRGFAVVAEEIRKMAQNSSQSVKDIKMILQKIQIATRNVVLTVSATAELGERQAAATEEMSATMEQLREVVAEIEKIASVL
jgi:methyl-accepting chemotaxis protein